jgi:hypothetical protein
LTCRFLTAAGGEGCADAQEGGGFMRRIDLGVFEPADRTPDGSLDGERRRGNELGDVVSLATFLHHAHDLATA